LKKKKEEKMETRPKREIKKTPNKTPKKTPNKTPKSTSKKRISEGDEYENIEKKKQKTPTNDDKRPQRNKLKSDNIEVKLDDLSEEMRDCYKIFARNKEA